MKKKIIMVIPVLLVLAIFAMPFKSLFAGNIVQKAGSVSLGEKSEGSALLISGDYLYVFGGKFQKTEVGANRFDSLWTFSIKDPANPKLVGGWFPKSLDNLTGNRIGWQPLIKYKDLIFAPCTSYTAVIDVSNPESPKLVKKLMEGDPAIAACVYSHYLITADVMNEFRVFDIENNFKQVNITLKGREKLTDFMPLEFFVSGKKLYGIGSGTAVFDLSEFPTIKAVKEFKYEGDPVNIENAKMFGRFIVGSSGGYGSGYELIDTKTDSFRQVEVKGLKNVALDKFAMEGRTLYAVANIREKETLYGIDGLNLLSPKILWEKKTGKTVNDIAVKMGYIYMLTENEIDIYNSAPFEDVPPNYWAIKAIKYMVSKNIVSGYPDGTFKPEKIVTRAEYAKMLALSLNLDVSKGRDIYADVPSSHWAYKYITAVTDAKLMKGYGNGKFGPNDTVKKEEIITTIVRLKHWKLEHPTAGTFPDVPKNYWAFPYIETAVKHGLIKKFDKGLTDGNFHIKVGATRAQTAELLYRAIKK